MKVLFQGEEFCKKSQKTSFVKKENFSANSVKETSNMFFNYFHTFSIASETLLLLPLK